MSLRKVHAICVSRFRAYLSLKGSWRSRQFLSKHNKRSENGYTLFLFCLSEFEKSPAKRRKNVRNRGYGISFGASYPRRT